MRRASSVAVMPSASISSCKISPGWTGWRKNCFLTLAVFNFHTGRAGTYHRPLEENLAKDHRKFRFRTLSFSVDGRHYHEFMSKSGSFRRIVFCWQQQQKTWKTGHKVASMFHDDALSTSTVSAVRKRSSSGKSLLPPIPCTDALLCKIPRLRKRLPLSMIGLTQSGQTPIGSPVRFAKSSNYHMTWSWVGDGDSRWSWKRRQTARSRGSA